MRKAFIKADVGSMSMICVHGEFPYSHGNYCSNSEGFYFTNIWAENLEHVLASGALPDGKVEVMLFRDDTDTRDAYALVIDERVPKEALHSPYFCGIRTSVEVLRYAHNIADDVCLCEVDNLKHVGTNRYSRSGLKTGRCYQCGDEFTIQSKRSTGLYRLKRQLPVNEFGYIPEAWCLAWHEDGVFKTIPDLEIIPHDVIVTVDIDKVGEFGSVKAQKEAIPLKDFIFSGLVSKRSCAEVEAEPNVPFPFS